MTDADDANYLRGLAGLDQNKVFAARLDAIADKIERDHNALMEIRGLVRPIIQNAPRILEEATDD